VSSPGEDPRSQVDALKAELDAVRRRDGEFRANMVREFLDRGERNTYLHTLHEELAALRRREQEASADLEQLTRKIESGEARIAALDSEMARIRGSAAWRLAAPLRALGRLFPPAPAAPAATPPGIDGAVFTYYLHTSPFRVYRDASFTLRGWAWPRDGGSITAVRVNLSGREFPGRIGIEEPEVIARYGPQPANPRPGFEVTFDTPAGKQALSLEAQIGGAGWRWIMRTSIWCEPGRT
jgi:hypothetical protein